MSDLAFVGRRRRGRPPSDVPKARRTYYVPPAYIDRIDRMALRHGISANEAFCKMVDLALRMPATRPEFRDSNK